MKSFLKFIAVALIIVNAGCTGTGNKVKTVEGASIAFMETEHDYGTMKMGDDGTYEFEFTNNGTEPLLFNNVISSCGCTVPEWPQEPIKPGEKGNIKVIYNTQITGSFAKSISVYTNAAEEPVLLTIRGKVEEAESL
jgi:hypothetical protein